MPLSQVSVGDVFCQLNKSMLSCVFCVLLNDSGSRHGRVRSRSPFSSRRRHEGDRVSCKSIMQESVDCVAQLFMAFSWLVLHATCILLLEIFAVVMIELSCVIFICRKMPFCSKILMKLFWIIRC